MILAPWRISRCCFGYTNSAFSNAALQISKFLDPGQDLVRRVTHLDDLEGLVVPGIKGTFDVRYAPDSGAKADIAGLPLCANRRLTHRNRFRRTDSIILPPSVNGVLSAAEFVVRGRRHGPGDPMERQDVHRGRSQPPRQNFRRTAGR
jgi:hypothetical protein